MSAFDDYCTYLSDLIQECIEHNDPRQIEYVRKLWDNESWESIKRKYNQMCDSESSIWIVWWYDGVNNYMLKG